MNKRIIACISVVALVAALCFYMAVAFYYGQHLYPHTNINGFDFSNADKDEISAEISKNRENHVLKIYGRELNTFENTELFNISAEDVELKYVVEYDGIEEIFNKQKSWIWPLYIWGEHNCELQENIEIDENRLIEILEAQDFFMSDKLISPKDAYIEGYDVEEGKYVLVPEEKGTRIDINNARDKIMEAIIKGVDAVDLEEQNCYIEPSVTADDEDLQRNLTQVNKWLETRIIYDWNGTEIVLDKDTIKDWVLIKNGNFVLDDSAIANFVGENAAEYDTYGKYRNFNTTMGYELQLPGGAFGWLTDRETEAKALKTLIETGTVGEREPEYAVKAPCKGIDDIGNTYVEADMTYQHLYLYQQGELVLETDFVSGNMSNGCMTPEGVFGLTYKTTNAVLRGADYVTPVSYWMPFNGNVGMHDATWRTEFGGDIYLNNGSHGCLNLPLDKAEEIYQYMKQGFPIICYYYPPDLLQQNESEPSEEAY